MCGNFTQYVCKCNLSIRFYNSDYFSLSIDTGLLSSIFKAYFTGIFICRTTDTVSYTHLDVYKRQSFGDPAQNSEAAQ